MTILTEENYMKIVLSINEVNEILVDYLYSKGKLENKTTDIHWCVAHNNVKESYIEFEQ
jgi:hypothetical protein